LPHLVDSNHNLTANNLDYRTVKFPLQAAPCVSHTSQFGVNIQVQFYFLSISCTLHRYFTDVVRSVCAN